MAERSETVRQLTVRVHDLEANEGDVHRKKGAAERKAVVLERQIGGYVEDIQRLEAKYHEGVETTLTLEKRCKEEEAKLREEEKKVEALVLELAVPLACLGSREPRVPGRETLERQPQGGVGEGSG